MARFRSCHLSFPQEFTGEDLRIYSSMGTLVESVPVKTEKLEMNLNGIEAGYYVGIVEKQEKIQRRSFIMNLFHSILIRCFLSCGR